MRCACLFPLAKMRPLRSVEEVGVSNLMGKQSVDLKHAKEAWDEWEIHCLILLSLSLQVFLCLTADLRRRSASRVLSNVLWLAYLSADTVAIFVLGHLAMHARGPSHELMLFWAPFVLVHLGGQDNITAFSKQDNELWTRHLLSLVTQTAVAMYVVSQSSWPDARLRAAMVLMLLCGFLKYAGRTFCLFIASPKSLRVATMVRLSGKLAAKAGARRKQHAEERFELMFFPDRSLEFKGETRFSLFDDEILFIDAPIDDWDITIVADELPDMLKEFKNRPDRCIAYQYVAECLDKSYRSLYTKAPLSFLGGVGTLCPTGSCPKLFLYLIFITWVLAYTFFQCISTAIALVLFASAQKEGHYSKADINVSYILLVGAIVLGLLPAFTTIVSYARKPFRPGTVGDCVDLSVISCVQPRGWLTRKQWSEELAQYSLTRRYITSVQDNYRCMPSIRKWILKCKPLGAWCAELFDLTRTPVTEDLKLIVLDRLLLLQTRREEWDFASFRGERALGKWMGNRHQGQEPERSSYAALHESLSSRVDFPTSVLIWHIATDICYFSGDKGIGTEPDETKKNKKMSRELSHYIMYLVFKCDVMLTTNSRLVHKKTHEELTRYFPQIEQDEKETVIAMFEAMKKNAMEEEAMKKDATEDEAMKKAEQQQGSTLDNKKNEEPANNNKDAAATSSRTGIKEVLQSMQEALYSPVLPRAHEVAQELIGIDNEADRWELILEVWLEMLFYTAPRCGASFHYEHLSTGGEFITHVLFLMRSLGPFMPKPAGA